MRRRWFFLAPAALAGIVLFTFIGGEAVRLLWNWLTPPLFGWREITFWQAIGLLALCRILFGGFGRHGSHGYTRYTPEQRARFREAMHRRFGGAPATTESSGQ